MPRSSCVNLFSPLSVHNIPFIIISFLFSRFACLCRFCAVCALTPIVVYFSASTTRRTRRWCQWRMVLGRKKKKNWRKCVCVWRCSLLYVTRETMEHTRTSCGAQNIWEKTSQIQYIKILNYYVFRWTLRNELTHCGGMKRWRPFRFDLWTGYDEWKKTEKNDGRSTCYNCHSTGLVSSPLPFSDEILELVSLTYSLKIIPYFCVRTQMTRPFGSKDQNFILYSKRFKYQFGVSFLSALQI